MAPSSIRVLSLAVHEAEDVAVDQCLNYVLVGGFDRVVLHVNRRSAFRDEAFTRAAQSLDPLRDRVHVNPHSGALTPLETHPQWIHDLFLAHLRNYRYACAALGPFDCFAVDASNSLVLRHGLPDYVNGCDGLTWHENRMGEFWLDNLKRDPIWLRMGERVIHGSHEGSFFTREHFAAFADQMQAYADSLDACRARGESIAELCREEVLFQTFWRELYSHLPRKDSFTLMRYNEKGLEWDLEEVEALLQDPRLLQEKYAIKRVQRHIDDPIRKRVGEAFGYRPALMAALSLGGL